MNLIATFVVYLIAIPGGMLAAAGGEKGLTWGGACSRWHVFAPRLSGREILMLASIWRTTIPGLGPGRGSAFDGHHMDDNRRNM